LQLRLLHVLSHTHSRRQVQLQLRRFTALKTDRGHARYVLFRNAVGI
jgi:hypothetical protein